MHWEFKVAHGIETILVSNWEQSYSLKVYQNMKLGDPNGPEFWKSWNYNKYRYKDKK